MEDCEKRIRQGEEDLANANEEFKKLQFEMEKEISELRTECEMRRQENEMQNNGMKSEFQKAMTLMNDQLNSR